MSRLKGQAAIVTGGAQGIGGATARRLAREGASVLVVDINQAQAEANAATIREAGGIARGMEGDVSQEDVIKRMVETAVGEWGRLDILVQNAYGGGRDRHGSAVTLSVSGWDSGMGLLTRALFLGAKHAVPEMQRNGGGSIVNISSVHGILMAADSLVYEAGKSAVIGMTRQMAIDFGPSGIRVNAIAPGHIVTENMEKRWQANGNELGREFFNQQYPVRRTGVPDDIANAIAFLCSEDASFITGVVLPVDGGLSIQLQENLGAQLANWALEHPEFKLPY